LRYLILLGGLSLSYGQGFSPSPHHIRFEGVVLDSTTGEPIPDVVVSGGKCDRKTITDAAGRFTLECPYGSGNGPVMFKQGYVLHGIQTQGIEGNDAEGNSTRRNIVRQMWAPAKIFGRVIDVNGTPAQHVAVYAEPASSTHRESAWTGSDGGFELLVAPSSYRLCAISDFDSQSERATLPVPPRQVAVSSCFASPVTAERAKEAGPLVIRLPIEKVWSIEGRIVTEPLTTPDWAVQVWAIARNREDAALPSPAFYRGKVDGAKGSFVISGLRTGSYTLLLRAGPANQCNTCPMPPEYEERIPIQVNRVMTGIVATIHPFSVIPGHVEGRQQSVILDSGMPARFSVADRTSAKVDDTGSFRIERVSAGRYLVVQNQSESGLLRTVRLDGRLMLHGEIQIAPGSSPKLEITFKEAAATAGVRVEETAGERISIVAVPENGWSDTISWAGPIRVTSSTLTVGVARSGTYRLFAIKNLAAYPVEEWVDALKRHEREGTRADLSGFDGAVINLKPLTLD
jgi:hypothetical protein